MPVALKIDELLYELLSNQDLLKFAPILAKDSITKIDHLKDVTNSELTVSFYNNIIYCCKFIS